MGSSNFRKKFTTPVILDHGFLVRHTNFLGVDSRCSHGSSEEVLIFFCKFFFSRLEGRCDCRKSFGESVIRVRASKSMHKGRGTPSRSSPQQIPLLPTEPASARPPEGKPANVSARVRAPRCVYTRARTRARAELPRALAAPTLSSARSRQRPPRECTHTFVCMYAHVDV